MFTLSGCYSKKSLPENQIIKCGILKEPQSLDPQIVCDYSSRVVIENLFEGLLKIGENGEILPGVAYSFENNENFTEFTFYLRKDAFWSNKEKDPVLAKDFVFAIKRALKKETNAPYAYLLYCIKNAVKYRENAIKEEYLGIKALDDYTLKFTLETSNKDFLKILAEPVAMPCNEEFFNMSAGQYGMESSKILSNGPFKMKSNQDHFCVINLVRNENYRSKNKIIPRGITFTVNKTKDPIEAIKNKDLDISLIDKESVDSLGINFFENGKKVYWGIVFNEKNKITSNLNFKKSILASLNRNHILSCLKESKKFKILDNMFENKILPNFKVLGKSFSTTDFENLYSENATFFFDLFFKETKIKKFSSAAITCLDEEIPRKIVCNIIENLNKNLGYHFNMIPLSKEELFSKVSNDEYEIAIVPFLCESEFALDILRSFKEDISFNKLVKINNKDFDAYIESAYSKDSKETEKNVLNVQNYLIENALFYPLYEETLYFAVSKKIRNLKIHKNNRTIDFTAIEKRK